MANSKPLTLRRQKSKANSSRDVDGEAFSLEAEVFVDLESDTKILNVEKRDFLRGRNLTGHNHWL